MHDRVNRVALQERTNDFRIAYIAHYDFHLIRDCQRNPVDKLSKTTTSSPASRRLRTMWLPMYPAPPVTKTPIDTYWLLCFDSALQHLPTIRAASMGLKVRLRLGGLPNAMALDHPIPSCGDDGFKVT